MKHFYHYTTREGHEGIMNSLRLLPSTMDGKEHTHYGKGIYFGTLDPHFDAQYLGISEVASALFNQLSNGNLDKFFYYVEVRFADGRDYLPLQASSNPYLYILDTLDPLELSFDPPQPGRVQVISHGLTYWGQVKEMSGGSSKQDLLAETPGWKRSGSTTKPANNTPTDPDWKHSPWNINSRH